MADHLYWYTNPRFFTPTHYWIAWITVGALLVHIGAKADVVARALSRSGNEPADQGANAGRG